MTFAATSGLPLSFGGAKPAPKRRLSLGQVRARITSLAQAEVHQVLQLSPGAARGLDYSVANLSYPTNLQIRYENRVILETGFLPAGRAGWLPLPPGLSDRVEIVLFPSASCLDTVVAATSRSAENSRLTGRDGVVLVAAGRDQRALLRIPVRLGSPAVETVTLRWRTLAGTASDGRDGGDRADFQARAGVLIFRPGDREQVIEIPVYGDTPINAGSDRAFEIFARDSAYRQILNRSGLDPDSIDVQSIYGDLGYRVDRSFQGAGGFQALGLTASERFYVLFSDPDQGLFAEEAAREEARLLVDLRTSLGDKIDSPVYQRALELVQELKTGKTSWTFARATIHDAGRAPVLAIRGTEPTRELADVWTDLNPRGIGANQYNQNRSQLLTWLREVSQPAGLQTVLAPHITGHSLGGALAQWLAADYATTGSLGDVVTFNAPGISRAAAATDLSSVASVRHYVTSTDIVSLAGQAFLPGRTIISDVPGSFHSQVPIAGPHLHPVLVSGLSNGDQRPAGLVQHLTGTIDQPLFSYLPDPDYLLFLLAVSRIPVLGPGLAVSLTTRQGVEQVRALIGEGLFSAVARYSQEITLAQAVSRAAGSWSPLAWQSVSQWSAAAWQAAGHWDSQAWESTRFWNPDAWTALRSWSDQAWAATARWSRAAWAATTGWGAQAWHTTLQWFSGGAFQASRPLTQALIAQPLRAASISATSRSITATGATTATATTTPAPAIPASTVGSMEAMASWSDQVWAASSGWLDPVWEALGRQQSGNGDRLVLGTPAADRLQGDAGADILDGLGGEDQLLGGHGDDLLIAGTGTTRLEGGAGADRFLINNPGDGLVLITDFDADQGDQIALNSRALPFHNLADPAPDQLIYDRQSGRLSFDADGAGPDEARGLALLLNHPEFRVENLLIWTSPPPPAPPVAPPQPPVLPPSPSPSSPSPPPSEPTEVEDPAPQSDLVLTSLPLLEADRLHVPFESVRLIHNLGTVAAENVVLTEVMPSGVTLESVSGAEPSEIADRVIRFELGTLRPGERRTVGLTMSSIVTGTLQALSEVTGTLADADPFNNLATTLYTIRSTRPSRSDLQLTLTASSSTPVVGDLLTLNATLSNQGPGDAVGLLVAIPRLQGLVLEAAEAVRGVYDPATELWSVGSLEVGAATTLRLRLRVQQEGLWLAEAEVVDQTDLDRDSIAGNGRPGEDDQAIVALRAGSQPITHRQLVAGPRSVAAGQRDPITLPLTYADATGNTRLEDLALALHFDSRALQFNGVLQTVRPLAQAPLIEDDADDRDGNPATDQRVLLRWQDSSRNVSGSRLPVPLITASFQPTAEFDDTLIGLSAGSTLAGHGFVADPIAVQRRLWNLDIDGDGRIDNASDGALLMRFAFGYEIGPDLIRGLISTSARRRTAEAIGTYLQEGLRSGQLDLDGNGRFDALTDGLMVIRYNDDMAQGDQLTAGALAADATITSAAAITAHLQRLTTLL